MNWKILFVIFYVLFIILLLIFLLIYKKKNIVKADHEESKEAIESSHQNELKAPVIKENSSIKKPNNRANRITRNKNTIIPDSVKTKNNFKKESYNGIEENVTSNIKTNDFKSESTKAKDSEIQKRSNKEPSKENNGFKINQESIKHHLKPAFDRLINNKPKSNDNNNHETNSKENNIKNRLNESVTKIKNKPALKNDKKTSGDDLFDIANDIINKKSDY